jgi:hypothetical protein
MKKKNLNLFYNLAKPGQNTEVILNTFEVFVYKYVLYITK